MAYNYIILILIADKIFVQGLHNNTFKNRASGASLIWNQRYDFRPKLHNSKFNYHFITSILYKYFINPLYWAGLKKSQKLSLIFLQLTDFF